MIAGVVLFLPSWALAQSGADSRASKLSAMRDKYRPLLIFYPPSPDGQERSVREQRALFAGHEAELKDRNVVLLFVPSNDHATGAGAWADLRKQFQIDSKEFTAVLVGKDGGEKFRSHEPVTIEKLDALIDAMPMRQQEMRDGQHAD